MRRHNFSLGEVPAYLRTEGMACCTQPFFIALHTPEDTLIYTNIKAHVNLLAIPRPHQLEGFVHRWGTDGRRFCHTHEEPVSVGQALAIHVRATEEGTTASRHQCLRGCFRTGQGLFSG